MARKAELWRATLPDVMTWRLRRDELALRKASPTTV
jgi:hypothetical protein